MASGGYREPSNPSPVSGPGALSQRTDGGPTQPMMPMTGGAYGEAQEMAEIQGGAPMAAAPAPVAPTPLNAPTDRPSEPATAGMPFGPGRNPMPGETPSPYAQDMQALGKYLPMLEEFARMGDVPKTFQAFILQLRSYK